MTAPKKNATPASVDGAGSVLSTVAGPSTSTPPASLGNNDPVPERLLEKTTAEKQLAAAMPYNPTKAGEYGDAARTPSEGAHNQPSTPAATGSTSTEIVMSDKVGNGQPPNGENRTTAPLDRVRVDAGNQVLTTNQGVPIADNQNSLKIGLRGPTAMEDFILREKITHFDHERIPERVVHARGSAAHGFFESYGDYTDLTRAVPLAEKGKRTPVFVRFSTVAGERGSTDTARDVRGFAVKFYTEQGNWDLVGNNIPVFFIQDAMKFPDLVHAAKPEPHHGMPQAATAHDTFWDFASLSPEITHMLMWAMSDRAIPRSYRTMQGFGVHTFRLINAQGESRFVKFHWTPLQGTHSLVWDEAVRISGADSDFHRRDLWEAIEGGNFPQWELGLQIFTEEQAASFPFDILDSTKLVPEELVPVTPVGRMVLDRNPDNFFAETEQVAFCTAHIIPGIDFSNDPLLQGRNHSYLDTQISRLGGANFHEIPINTPIVQIQNNQRDGMHRQAIARGRVSYEPNSLGGGCPFQAGRMGFTSFPEAFNNVDKVRGKPELFAEHYGQARLFYQSQSPAEQTHIANAFRFELSRVQTLAVRQRVLAQLANVDAGLVAKVAEGLGLDVPEALPRVNDTPIPAYEPSPSLSLLARPGQTGIRTRRVAILVANGVDGDAVRALYADLLKDGAVPRLVGNMLGKVKTSGGDALDVEISLEAGPSVMYDAVIVADGGADLLARNAQAIDFLREQYRHCKPILVLGNGANLLTKAMIPQTLPDGSADPSLLVDGTLDAFKEALASHRSFDRETDPPMV
ncbi:catalase [Massilia forsythiae]|uniref:Catalase n=1 Tax=Massilia forsythiae TaxID=2728020 RepID=A0A7Z2VV76_9BURK|nr:catalase [Massilia forsythiae]QJD99524.1 catalase [Massilia forsythiae]